MYRPLLVGIAVFAGYACHQADARRVENSRRCQSSKDAICVQDTLWTRTAGVPGSDVSGVTWIVFSSADDTIAFEVVVDSTTMFDPDDPSNVGVALQRSVLGGGWVEREPDTHMLKPYVHARIHEDGAYRLDIAMSGIRISGTTEDSVPYVLAVRRPVGSPALRPTGGRALLQLVGDTAAVFALIPNSVPVAAQRGHENAWGIKPGLAKNGRYSVLLVADSMYRICRLPCSKVESVVLKPNVTSSWTP